MFERLHHLDQDITLWLNMHQPCVAIDYIMVFFLKDSRMVPALRDYHLLRFPQ